ncbi:unnamed protein product [Cuscuta campestris]|uniref:Uncharacterized protein n=1 Tax=Cuscuta campestris TaxID=132261 RepID=A0A484KV14_9ASTE|nr:unnamed protein product [Cuscuta campestris]
MSDMEIVPIENPNPNLILNAYTHANVIEGRVLKHEDYPDAVLALVDEQGWTEFLQLEAPVYPDLVVEFYDSLQYACKSNVILSKVVGVGVSISVQNLADWFRLPLEGLTTYTKKGWMAEFDSFSVDECLTLLNTNPKAGDTSLRRPEVQGLTANNFILLKISRENLVLVVNKDKLVGMLLLYYILTHRRISLPHFINQHLFEASGNLNRPYGMLLTHIFAKHGILELSPSRFRYLDAECLGYFGLVKIGATYYMKRKFERLDDATRARFGPRRSTSSVSRRGSSSTNPQGDENEPENGPPTTRLKRSRTTARGTSSSTQDSSENSVIKESFNKLKDFIKNKVVNLSSVCMNRWIALMPASLD